MISKKFKTPIYGIEFEVVIFDNEKEFDEKFKDFDFKVNPKDFTGCVFSKDQKLYMTLSAEEDGYPTPGLIAHESLHLMNEIFINISHFKSDRNNDEPDAYLLSWIVNRIHELINSKENNKNKK